MISVRAPGVVVPCPVPSTPYPILWPLPVAQYSVLCTQYFYTPLLFLLHQLYLLAGKMRSGVAMLLSFATRG